jgi:signal peptidase I
VIIVIVAATGATSCCAGLVAFCLVLARRHMAVVRVNGRSMLPSFRPGERVLIRRASVGDLAVGMVAVARAPVSPQRWIVKRVAALPGDAVPESVRAAAGGLALVPIGTMVLLADNPAGRDSRHWGLVAADDLLGYVVTKLRRDTSGAPFVRRDTGSDSAS